ncbi:MAG: YcxB family protein [Ruminococcus sp.]|nr:YcxB family protein [Ruminococcus sp.]
MTENIKLDREYTLPPETFREGYLAYQKKFLLRRSYIFMALFLILGADMAFAAVKEPTNKLAYVLMFICLAFAFKMWYDPRKARKEMASTFSEMGGQVYRLRIDGENAEISTVSSSPVVEAFDEEGNAQEEDLPEPTVIPLGSLTVIEAESCFLLCQGREMFYIVPKAEMTGEELEILRNIGK